MGRGEHCEPSPAALAVTALRRTMWIFIIQEYDAICDSPANNRSISELFLCFVVDTQTNLANSHSTTQRWNLQQVFIVL